ncbi:hypothetical protein, partial [Streptomyces sp. NPDC001537]
TSNTSLNGTGASCVAGGRPVTRPVATLKTLSVRNWSRFGVFTAIAILLMAFSIMAHYRWPMREADDLSASRQRVRAAEQGLEEDLRLQELIRAQPDSFRIRTPDGSWVTYHRAGEPDEESANRLPGSESATPGALHAGHTPLALGRLWLLTHSRLDLYHEIATGQARRSFLNAQIAMGIGFALLVAFVVVAAQASTTAGAIVAGGLGAVSAALAGFVSRTFVRSQETAASHLKAYFDQPLEFSRYLAAERLVSDSQLNDTQRAEAVAALVHAIVAGPPTETPKGSAAESEG